MLAWLMVLRAALWFTLVFLPVSLQAQISEPHDSPASLPSLIMKYLSTPNADQADELLGKILSRDDATLPAVSSILSKGRSYTSARVGMQPEQEVTVGSQLFEYGLYVPENYRSEKAYPLVICLHGAGFTGNDSLVCWQA